MTEGAVQFDLIEVVYFSYGALYVESCEPVVGALEFIRFGEDAGRMSSVGVFRNGEPIIENGYASQEAPPSADRAMMMRSSYSEAVRNASTAADQAHVERTPGRLPVRFAAGEGERDSGG